MGVFGRLRRWFRSARHAWSEGKAGEHSQTALIDALVGQISAPGKARSVLNSVSRFRDLTRAERREELPSVYLLLERYLTEVDPYPRFTVEQLRDLVRNQYAELLESERFSIIFEGVGRQEVMLSKTFLDDVLTRSYRLLGHGGDSALSSLKKWLVDVPSATASPAPLMPNQPLPASDEGWFELLTQVSERLYQHLDERLGEAADRIYEASFETVARSFSQLDAFPEIVRMLPEQILDEHKIRLLSHRRQLHARTREVEEVQDALEAAQERALESSAQLQAVLDTVREGIVTVDQLGTIRLINREAESVWGYPHGYLIGRNIATLTEEHYRLQDFISMGVTESERRGFSGWTVDVIGLHEDGSVFPLELRLTETRIGESIMYTAAARDITDRKRYEDGLIEAKERAEDMARLKSTFLANMSHEIRTPLTGIMGFAALLSEVVDEKHLEYAQLIRKSGQRLLDTLNSILDLAYLESGEFEVEFRRLDVVEEVRAVLPVFRTLAAEKGLSLQLRAEEPSIYAVTDPSGLHRILNNLIGNALKFTERGGATISVRADDDNIFVRVADTGIGIGDQFLPDLFSEFKQESTGLRRQYEGSGLGLAITKHIVDELNGEIAVESQRGTGTTFTVALPRTPISRSHSSRKGIGLETLT